MLAAQCLVSHCIIPPVSPPCWFFGSFPLFPLNITLLGLRNNPELCLKSSDYSLQMRLLHGRLDALSFAQFSHLYLLLFCHGIPDCHGVLLTLYLPHEGCHFRLHWLTLNFGNTEGLC